MRFRALDGWRGLLAVTVALLHAGLGLESAYLAVDVFFLLSGFVLTYRYDRDSGPTLVRYVTDRVRRLLPLHLTVLGLIAVVALVLAIKGVTSFYAGHPELVGVQSIPRLVWDALLLTNIIVPATGDQWGLNGPSWSISVEMWVGLLLWPLWFRPGSGRMLRGALAAVGAMALYGLLAGTFGNLIGAKEGVLVVLNVGVVRGVAGFLLGYACYQAYAAWRPRLAGLGVVPATCLEITIALCAWLVLDKTEASAIDFAIVPIGCAILIVFSLERGLVAKLLTCPPFVVLGSASFYIYLCHQPAYRVFRAFFPVESSWWAFAIAIGIAGVLWLLMEKGARKMLIARTAPEVAPSA